MAEIHLDPNENPYSGSSTLDNQSLVPSIIPPPPPLPNSLVEATPTKSNTKEARSNAVSSASSSHDDINPEEAYGAVIKDFNKMIQGDGYLDTPYTNSLNGDEDNRSTHVDGEYMEGYTQDNQTDTQTTEPELGVTMRERKHSVSFSDQTEQLVKAGRVSSLIGVHQRIIDNNKNRISKTVNNQLTQPSTPIEAPHRKEIIPITDTIDSKINEGNSNVHVEVTRSISSSSSSNLNDQESDETSQGEDQPPKTDPTIESPDSSVKVDQIQDRSDNMNSGLYNFSIPEATENGSIFHVDIHGEHVADDQADDDSNNATGAGFENQHTTATLIENHQTFNDTTQNTYEIHATNSSMRDEWQEGVYTFEDANPATQAPNPSNRSFAVHEGSPNTAIGGQSGHNDIPSSIYQKSSPQGTATIIDVDTMTTPASSTNRKGVTFSSETIYNESSSPRYPKDTVIGGTQVNHVIKSHNDTYPVDTQEYAEQNMTIVLNTEEDVPMSGSSTQHAVSNTYSYTGSYPSNDSQIMTNGITAGSYGHVNGHRPMASMSTTVNQPTSAFYPHGQTRSDAYPDSMERVIKISDSDTWERTATNTSVVTIGSSSSDIRSYTPASLANPYSPNPYSPDHIPMSNPGNQSLQRSEPSLSGLSGVSKLPLMMVTSRVPGHPKLGPFYGNGTTNGSAMVFQPEHLDMLSEKDKEKLLRRRKHKRNKSVVTEIRCQRCRLIALIVIVILSVALILGLVLGLAV